MFLAGTEEIQFDLDAAADNANVEAYAWYEDHNEETGKVSRGSNRETGAGTDDVTLVDAVYTDDAKERTVRCVKGINFYNADDATRTVTFFYYNGTTAYKLISVALLTHEYLQWSPDQGWQVLTATGQQKTLSPAT